MPLQRILDAEDVVAHVADRAFDRRLKQVLDRGRLHRLHQRDADRGDQAADHQVFDQRLAALSAPEPHTSTLTSLNISHSPMPSRMKTRTIMIQPSGVVKN